MGCVYAREERKSDQISPHAKHMGDYCRGLNAHVIHSSLRTRGLTTTGVRPYYLLRVLAPLATPSVYTV